MPEAGVFEHFDLAVGSQTIHRALFENQIVTAFAQIIEDARRANKIAPRDQTTRHLRLFIEAENLAIGADGQFAETPGRLNTCDGQQAPVRFMEGHQRGNVDIADTVTVGQKENIVFEDIRLNATDTPACHRVHAGFGQCDPPILGGLGRALLDVNLGALPQVKRYVVGVNRVVEEKLFDDLALIAKA